MMFGKALRGICFAAGLSAMASISFAQQLKLVSPSTFSAPSGGKAEAEFRVCGSSVPLNTIFSQGSGHVRNDSKAGTASLSATLKAQASCDPFSRVVLFAKKVPTYGVTTASVNGNVLGNNTLSVFGGIVNNLFVLNHSAPGSTANGGKVSAEAYCQIQNAPLVLPLSIWMIWDQLDNSSYDSDPACGSIKIDKGLHPVVTVNWSLGTTSGIRMRLSSCSDDLSFSDIASPHRDDLVWNGQISTSAGILGGATNLNSMITWGVGDATLIKCSGAPTSGTFTLDISAIPTNTNVTLNFNRTIDWLGFNGNNPLGTFNFANCTLPQCFKVIGSSNGAPNVTVANTMTTANEGATLTNSGNWSDPNVGDVVTLTASSGTVVKNANGTWSWTMPAGDGPADGTVTITARDTTNATNAVNFSYHVNNVAPTLNLTGGATVNEGSTYSLSLAATDPGPDTITSWSINWGDGSTNTVLNAASGTVSHTFANGPFDSTITVTASDEDGSYVKTKVVSVTDVAPILSVVGSGSVLEGSEYTVNLSVTDPGNDVLSSLVVNWGDGTSSSVGGSATSASHTYADGGATYAIVATATDANGSYSSPPSSVVVSNVAPTLQASGAGSVNEGSPYTLTFGRISDPGQDTITGWSINWGDGVTTSAGAGATTATHTYADGSASYTIVATATDEDGSYPAPAVAVTVNNVAPTLTLAGNSSVNEGATYNLALSATDPGQDTISQWSVNWGDGSPATTSTGAAPSLNHVYADGLNVYTITVTAIDEDGTYTATKSVTVNNVAPALSLVGNATTPEGATYSLTLSASGDAGADTITSWTINWGDTTETVPGGNSLTVTHVYPDGPTPYTIHVTATDEDGTYNGPDKPVTVTNVAPTLTVHANAAVGGTWPSSESFGTFTDPGTLDTPWTYSVNWGDGSAVSTGSVTSTGSLPGINHSFPSSANTFTVTVTVTDKDGGSDTKTFVVTTNSVQLLSYGLTQNPIHGGDHVTGIVTLTGPAPIGGADVQLTNDALASASIPLVTAQNLTHDVYIMPVVNNSVAQKRVWRVQNTNPFPVTITYKMFFEPSQEGTVVLAPNSYTFFATNEVVGNPDTIQIFRNGNLWQSQSQGVTPDTGPQIPAGLWVQLMMPTHILVPEGQTSATFDIGTVPVPDDTFVHLTASYVVSIAITMQLRFDQP